MDLEPPQEAPKPFRMTPQVFLVLAIVLLALALPVTAVILGVMGFFGPRTSAPAPEIPQLRQAVEAVADKTLVAPTLDADRRVIALTGTPDEIRKRRGLLLSAAEEHGASVVDFQDRLLVTVPRANASAFELAALVPPASEPPASDPVLYQFSFPAP
jgi:hypothetical protein